MTPGKLLLTFVFFPDAFLPPSSPQKRKKNNNLQITPAPPAAAKRVEQRDFALLLTHFIITMDEFKAFLMEMKSRCYGGV